MQKDLKKFEEAGLTIVGISYDSVDVLAKFTEQSKITFPLLSDPDSKVIKAFGIFDKQAKGKTEGIPYPGTFVIDSKGIVRAKLFHEGPFQRHTTADLLKAAAEVK